jgi:hypothetical protein
MLLERPPGVLRLAITGAVERHDQTFEVVGRIDVEPATTCL